MSRFFCDTNSDLWFSHVEELGANVIYMPYTLDDEEHVYDLGKNDDITSFYKALANGADAKTQALNTQNYLDYFEPVLAQGEDILYVHFSSEMSGTFRQMQQAIDILKEKYPERKITTVDTKLISIGEGLLMYEAGKLWKSGASDEEVVEFVEKNRNNYALYFVVKDLTQLKRGGRLSGTSYVVGTMLNIKPIIYVNQDGVLGKFGVAQGAKGGVKALVKRVKELGCELTKHPIIISHSGAPELADEIENMLISEFGDELEIWKWPIGPVVTSHCGVGTVGVAFYAKER